MYQSIKFENLGKAIQITYPLGMEAKSRPKITKTMLKWVGISESHFD